MSTQTDALVVLRSALGLEEALTLQSALDAAGIPAHVFDAGTATMNWTYLFALGGIRVVVHESDYAAAAAIADEGDRGEHGETCAACGSRRLTRKKSLIGAGVGLLFLVPLWKRTSTTQCLDCRHFWKSE